MRHGWIIGMALALAACTSFYVDPADSFRESNKANLQKLSVGMEKSIAMEVMGTEPSRGVFMWIDNPYRSEDVTAKDGKRYEILYYYTDMKQRDDKITDDELTPLVFRDGKLVAWGNDAVKRLGK